MIISKPKEYINMLIDDICNVTKKAMSSYTEERLMNMCSISTSMDKLNIQMLKVNALKEEILKIVEACVDDNQ